MDDSTPIASPGQLRFLVLVLVAVVVYVATSWSFTTDASREQSISQGTSNAMANASALPLVHASGDSSLTGRTYTNTRYGVSITYPKGWLVSSDTSDPNELMSATNDGLQMYSELNAGIFSDLATSSRDAYLTVLWRVERNIQLITASSSAGILYSETSSFNDIASSSATRLTLNYFWDMPDGSIGTYYDWYFVFGKGPVYYTLEFITPNQNPDVDAINSEIQTVLNSIKVTDPQLQR